MEARLECPECGAKWTGEQTCTDHFHTMLAWELDQQMYDVHHLLVLSYHLQHPSLYSPEGLAGARRLLVEFLEQEITPQAMRKRIGNAVDSGTRTYKIKGMPGSHGAYLKPVQWQMRAGDVMEAGLERLYPRVRQWAGSVLESLRASGNLP